MVVSEAKLRKKYPSKNPRNAIAAKKKAVELEYRRKRAELGFGPPSMKRGLPYYMMITLGMLLLAGFVCSAIFRRGGIDLSNEKVAKAEKSLQNLAVALGRYRYHVGVYPSTGDGLAQLSKTRLNVPGWLGPYITEIKSDPWGNGYVYVNNGDRSVPTLYSKGPDGASATTDDILVDKSFFDEPFRDASWTEGWVPWHLRDIMWVENEREKEIAERRVAAALGVSHSIEGVSPLSEDWLFIPGDDVDKAFDVRLPVDWRSKIFGDFADLKEASFARRFFVNKDAEGYYIALRLASVHGDFSVCLNGAKLEVEDAGRDGYAVNLTDAVRFGVENELKITIRENTLSAGSAGITGEVWVEFSDPAERVIAGSVKVLTKKLSKAVAEITVKRVLSCHDGTNADIKEVSKDYVVDKPKIWSLDNPVVRKGNITGNYVIRTIEPSTEKSVVLNGRETLVKGVVAADSSLGIFGGAFSERQARMKLAALKEAGVNTIVFGECRTNRAYFDLCDEIGLLAFDLDDVKRLKLDTSQFLAIKDIPDEEILAELKSRFMPDTKTLFVGPDWNGVEGEKRRIECVTDADSVELFVNDVSAGLSEKLSDNHFVKDVVFEPGELKAIARKNGVYYTEKVLKTAYKPEALRFLVWPWILKENESAVIEIALSDGYGQIVPDGSAEVEFTVEDGPGEFVACGNSNDERGSVDRVTKRKASAKLFNARAYVAVRRAEGSHVPIRIKAVSPGLRTARAILPYRFR